MGRIYNIQQGKSKAVDFTGLKELQQRVNQLKDRATSQACLDIMADSAKLLYDQAARNLDAVNAPHEVKEDLFVFAQQKGKVAVLTGLKKRGTSVRAKGYVEWNAKDAGKKIGENLGTMWELGTSKMAPKPWWRPAVQAVRGAMFTSMASGLRRLIGGDAP